MTDQIDTRRERDTTVGPDVVLDAWRRRKWIALAAGSLVLAAATTVTLSLPNLYRASATVIVERQQVSEAFVRPSVTAELETRIQLIDQRIRSRARLENIINRFALYPELRGLVPPEALVDRMNRDIELDLKGVDQATGRTATIAFTLSYSGRDPRIVADVANSLASSYVNENAEARGRQAERTATFLKQQLEQVKTDLDAQERLTSAYTRQHGDELPQQLQANLATLERLNTQLRLNGERQIRALERRERIEQGQTDGRLPAPDTASPVAQLARLRRELADLQRQFSDRYPDVIRVKGEIAALERQLAASGTPARPAALADPAARLTQTLAEVDGEINTLKQEEAMLRRTIAGYETRIESAPRRQQDIQELSRGSDTTRERYQALLKQYEDAQLAATLEQGQGMEQLRILDPAIPPLRPTAPNRMQLMAMGLVASIAMAIAAVVLMERLDTTFHTVDDLRTFVNVPTLASIRQIRTKTAIQRERRQFALLGISVIVGLAVAVAGSYYVASGNEQLVRMTMRGRS